MKFGEGHWSPSPGVSSNLQPSVRFLLLNHLDRRCPGDRHCCQCSHHVYCKRSELAILIARVLVFRQQEVWRSRKLFSALLCSLEPEVSDQRYKRVAPGQTLSVEVEGLFGR